MKDKSAFEESVFNKSEIIFAKRKRRRKLIASLTSSSLCVLLLFTLLLRSPISLDDFMPMEKSEAYAPEVENAGGHFYNKADEDKMTDASLDYDKKAEEESADAPSEPEAVVSTAAAPAETQAPAEVPEISTSTEKEIPEITDKMPLFVEITVFGSTVTVYKDERTMENIRLALSEYFALEEKSDVAEACVTFIYPEEKNSFNVGYEFLEILKETEK